MSTCHICKKAEVNQQYKPFCSKRCADIDLGNWFNEKYSVEAVELDEKDMEQLVEVISSEVEK